MYYKLSDVTKGASTLSDTLTSFWSYVEFTANAASGKVGISQGYLAVYLEHTSMGQIPAEPDFPGPKGSPIKLEINGDGLGTLVFSELVLREKSKLRRSNEVGRLLLFDFVPDANGDRPWVDGSNWRPGFTDPTVNADGTPFHPDRFSFGDIKARYIFELVTGENNIGLRDVGIVCPLLNYPVSQCILDAANAANAGISLPVLEVKPEKDPTQSYFSNGAGGISGAVVGYAMTAHGVFTSIDADSMLHDWLLGAIPPAALVRRLGKVVSAGGRFQRTLGNVAGTHQTAVLDGKNVGDPVEVLYLTGINSSSKTPPLIL